MEWIYLGHATWLADLSGTRLLIDPLLFDLHHGGVFEIEPRRAKLDEAALCPDFIFISHRHPDHFDLRSLHRLARRDPGTVVITSDPLVAEATRRLGFERVEEIAPLMTIDLQHARLLTTPSYAGALEWGLFARDKDGAVWNMIDTVHRNPADVAATLAAAERAFETRDPPELALVPWQPLRELAADSSATPGFPFDDYARLLACAGATRAKAIVPTAAGARHADPYAWLNRAVYPVSAARFLADLGEVRGFPPELGAKYTIAGGEVVRTTSSLVEAGAATHHDAFRPFELPPLVDPQPANDNARARAGRWIEETLAPALARRYPEMAVTKPLRFTAELIFANVTDAYTITVSAGGARVDRRFDADYDLLAAIAGSMFVEVIEGRRHWGDPLLAGLMRTVHRAYQISAQGLARARVSAMFFYYGLSYEESFRRAIEHELEALTGTASPRLSVER